MHTRPTDTATPPAEVCYIGLGSNLNNPEHQLRRALLALASLPGTRLTASSRAYPNPAIGPGRQPDYLNLVACLHTTLAPLPLLHALQAIEQAQGRVREQRWAARSLDLDLLLYGQQVIDSAELTLPHPRMRERSFVLVPLGELAPELVLPDGTPLTNLLRHCKRGSLGTPLNLNHGAQP